MARGLRGERRPDDPAAAAVMVVRLATGEISEDDLGDSVRDKDPVAVARGRLGGLHGGAARAARLSPEERVSIAKRAADARWKANKGE